jgi:hypothetical protein
MMVHPRQQTVRQPAGADVEQHSGDLVGSEVAVAVDRRSEHDAPGRAVGDEVIDGAVPGSGLHRAE